MKRIANTFINFIFGDKRWGYLRLAFILITIVIFIRYGYQKFPNGSLEHIVKTWIDRQNALGLLPTSLLKFIAFLRHDHRFIWLSLWGFTSALIIGASYLKTIYDLPKLRDTFRYLISSLTGLLYPSVKIEKGKMQVPEDKINLVRDIGGPGHVKLQPGNVALFEHLHKPSNVQANRGYFLSRFETVKRFQSDLDAHGWEIPTLDDRHGNIEKIAAKTKDGITLIVEDINYRYRLRMGRALGDYTSRDPNNPYPFSTEAVRSLAYNRVVRKKDPKTEETELTPWHNTISGTVAGAITDYIREHRFNDIVVPSYGDDPRSEISERLFSRAVRNPLRNNGADLLWADIGHFRIDDQHIANQLVENWGTTWEGEADIRRAYGEAHRIELIERGRAEAQAEMLIEIMEAFEGLNLSQNTRENIANLVLARTAQILDGMRDRGPNSPRPNFPPILPG